MLNSIKLKIILKNAIVLSNEKNVDDTLLFQWSSD